MKILYFYTIFLNHMNQHKHYMIFISRTQIKKKIDFNIAMYWAIGYVI